jgi:hypothetical protein
MEIIFWNSEGCTLNWCTSVETNLSKLQLFRRPEKGRGDVNIESTNLVLIYGTTKIERMAVDSSTIQVLYRLLATVTVGRDT